MEAQDDQKQVAADHQAQLTLALTSASEPLTRSKSDKLAELEQQVLSRIKATFRDLELLCDYGETAARSPSASQETSERDSWQLTLLEQIEKAVTPHDSLFSFFSLMANAAFFESVDGFTAQK